MPLLMGKCGNCGGTIQMNEGMKSGVCPFCGTPYVAEDVVNNYYTTNTYNIGSAEIKLEDGSSIRERYETAEFYLTKLKQYDRAEKVFLELTDVAPNDYRCWWGLVRTGTGCFSDYSVGENRLREIERKWLNISMTIAPPELKQSMREQWDGYIEQRRQCRDKLIKHKEKLLVEHGKIEKELPQLRDKFKTLNKEIAYVKGGTKYIYLITSFILAAFCFINGIFNSVSAGLTVWSIIPFILGVVCLVGGFLLNSKDKSKRNAVIHKESQRDELYSTVTQYQEQEPLLREEIMQIDLELAEGIKTEKFLKICGIIE